METLWIFVAVIGGALILLGAIAVVAGIIMGARRRKGLEAADTDVWVSIFNWFKETFDKLIGIILRRGPADKQVRALGLVLILIGTAALLGGVYGASRAGGNGENGNTPSVTTTSTP